MTIENVTKIQKPLKVNYNKLIKDFGCIEPIGSDYGIIQHEDGCSIHICYWLSEDSGFFIQNERYFPCQCSSMEWIVENNMFENVNDTVSVFDENGDVINELSILEFMDAEEDSEEDEEINEISPKSNTLH